MELKLTEIRAIMQSLEERTLALSHKTMFLWGMAIARIAESEFVKKYPSIDTLKNAIELGAAFGRGDIKMPIAKRAILECHSVAKDIITDKKYCALAHAVGQAVAAAHVQTHAMGGAIYYYQAMMRDVRVDNHCESDRILSELNLMLSNCESEDKSGYVWASFMNKPSKHNRV